jgi:hypothetical protein
LVCGRLALAEVLEDAAQRLPQRVHVEPIEPDVRARRDVVVAKPCDEVGDLLVGPHPRRPAREVGERAVGVDVCSVPALHPLVDVEAIGPVALDGDEREASFRDEPPGQLGAPAVVLRRAVRGLAEQHVPGIADPLDQRIQIRRVRERRGE